MNRIISLIALVLFITACGTNRKAANSVMLEPVNINATDDAYKATATRYWDITHTIVALNFNLKDKTADGNATITMHPYFYTTDKIVLDAKSMKISSVLVNGNKARINYNNDSLVIYLERPYHRTEEVKVEVAYTAMPYANTTSGGSAIRDDKGLYFINTDNAIPYKPAQIWTQGETESNSFWVPTFDKPNERFTTKLLLTVPDSFTTLSNGRFVSSKKQGSNLRTDTWEMDKDIQPYVMMFAIGNFKVVEDKEWQGKKVNYYVEPEFAPYALNIFRNTPEMMEYFSNITGIPYPWNKYSQVVVRDYVSGAMENTSATVFGEFVNQTDREIRDKDYEDVVSHELFHQWFGDYVTAESWSNLTVNESFATYGEQLWRQYKYGTASAQQLGFEDMMLYMDQSDKNDAPLTRFHYKNRDDMFDRISYQKGATVLHYLHGLMGDSAFYHAMNIYLEDNALKPAEAHHWRLAVEKATGKDWNWFFNQWYFRGGHPVLEVKYDFDDEKKQVKISMEQKQQKLYELPIKIEVVTHGNTFSDLVTSDSRTVNVTYPYYNNERPAVFTDAEHWMPGELRDNKTPEHWLLSYNLAKKDDFITKVRALIANATKLGNSKVQEMYRLALTDNLEQVRVYALQYLENQKVSSIQDKFKSDVQTLATQDMSHHVRAAALDVLTAWKIKSAEADMYTALDDASYKVAAAALKGISKFEPDTAYILAKRILDKEPKGELIAQVWNVIGNTAEAADTNLVKDRQYRVAGNKKLAFSGSIANYMERTADDNAFMVALNAMEYMCLSESIAPYRAAIVVDIFDVAYFYKKETSDATTKPAIAKANKRLNILIASIDKIIQNETDEDNLARYKNYRNELLGKKS